MLSLGISVLTNISGLRIEIEFLDVQIARVDVVEFVGLLVPREPVRAANLRLQRHKRLFLAGEAIKCAQPLRENVNVKLWGELRNCFEFFDGSWQLPGALSYQFSLCRQRNVRSDHTSHR